LVLSRHSPPTYRSHPNPLNRRARDDRGDRCSEQIGSALVSELAVSGKTVRAMMRSGESASSVPDGVEPVLGDLADRDSLRSALSGADQLFLLCGPSEQEAQLNRNAIDVAREH